MSFDTCRFDTDMILFPKRYFDTFALFFDICYKKRNLLLQHFFFVVIFCVDMIRSLFSLTFKTCYFLSSASCKKWCHFFLLAWKNITTSVRTPQFFWTSKVFLNVTNLGWNMLLKFEPKLRR